MGSELAEDTVTVVAAAWLSTFPSFTMSEATNVPAASALKVGFDVVIDDKIAELPEGLVISAQVDKNKLILFVSNINQVKKYQIQLKDIKSKDGNAISFISYQFEGAFVPYGQLSDSEKNRQIKETDKGNLQDPVMSILPKYGDNYAIKYELFGEPSQKGKYIKLNIILLLEAQSIDNRDLARQYKNEALDFLKSNNINPNDYVIRYDPDYAAGL
jgi:hypothetical protein